MDQREVCLQLWIHDIVKDRQIGRQIDGQVRQIDRQMDMQVDRYIRQINDIQINRQIGKENELNNYEVKEKRY